MSILTLVIIFLSSLIKSQRQLALEKLALMQQATMLRQSVKRHRAMAYGWPNPYLLSTPHEAPNNPTYSTNPTPIHLPQTLPLHHRRRVRQVRRV
jgi:hypothetical protein